MSDEPPAPPPDPPPRRDPPRREPRLLTEEDLNLPRLGPAFWTVGVLGVGCAVAAGSLLVLDDELIGLAVLLAAAAVAPLGRTLVVLRGRARRGRETSPGKTVGLFLASAGITALILGSLFATVVIGTIAALFAYCGTRGLAGVVSEGVGMLAGSAIVIAAVGWVCYGWWRVVRRRYRRDVGEDADEPPGGDRTGHPR